MIDQPRQMVIGIFRRGPLFLVGEAYDRVKGERFYRPLGGGIEQDESPEQALVREMREELDESVRVLRHIGQIDNRFMFEGRPGWEDVYICEAEFAEQDAPRIDRVEAEEWRLKWISIDDLDAPLYPDGLADLLRGLPSS